jgi:hypothetical protein
VSGTLVVVVVGSAVVVVVVSAVVVVVATVVVVVVVGAVVVEAVVGAVVKNGIVGPSGAVVLTVLDVGGNVVAGEVGVGAGGRVVARVVGAAAGAGGPAGRGAAVAVVGAGRRTEVPATVRRRVVGGLAVVGASDTEAAVVGAGDVGGATDSLVGEVKSSPSVVEVVVDDVVVASNCKTTRPPPESPVK